MRRTRLKTLGIGLHAYGFMDGAFFWLYGFIATQLAIIGLALIPLNYWKSFRGPKPPSDPTASGKLPATASA